uniref:Cadherin domain-containing protein n=1 Tax=Anopheles culicifacies TaxID=139723 RepID=A0A182M042_9DIPT
MLKASARVTVCEYTPSRAMSPVATVIAPHIMEAPMAFADIVIRVNVLDKNDSPPRFQNLPLVFSVSEDLAVGQTVARITATDPDTLGKLEYTLLEGDAPKFALERETGLLKLRDTLDRETEDAYRLKVSVTDGIQSTETTITIQVGFGVGLPYTSQHSPHSTASCTHRVIFPANAQRVLILWRRRNQCLIPICSASCSKIFWQMSITPSRPSHERPAFD